MLSISGSKANDYFENLFSDLLLEKNGTEEYKIYEELSSDFLPEINTENTVQDILNKTASDLPSVSDTEGQKASTLRKEDIFSKTTSELPSMAVTEEQKASTLKKEDIFSKTTSELPSMAVTVGQKASPQLSEPDAQKNENSPPFTGDNQPSSITYELLLIAIAGCCLIIITGGIILVIKLQKKVARQSEVVTLTNFNFNPNHFDEISL